MRYAEPRVETEQIHHLAENLMHQVVRGREWATPGVQAAVQRAVAGLDAGIEPRRRVCRGYCVIWLKSSPAGLRP